MHHVIDGDTVVLGDGRKLRLIGLDAPEIGHRGRPSEPLAVEARASLRGLVQGRGALGLQRGRQPRDRYGRNLGHLFIEGGPNVQAWLLKRGLATHLFVPPESAYTDCYAHAESLARAARRGLWRLHRFQVYPAAVLSGKISGYRVVKGRVTVLTRSLSSVWLKLDRGFGVQILDEDLPYFRSIDLDHIVDKMVFARGWVTGSDGRYRLRLRHARFLQIVE